MPIDYAEYCRESIAHYSTLIQTTDDVHERSAAIKILAHYQELFKEELTAA